MSAQIGSLSVRTQAHVIANQCTPMMFGNKANTVLLKRHERVPQLWRNESLIKFVELGIQQIAIGQQPSLLDRRLRGECIRRRIRRHNRVGQQFDQVLRHVDECDAYAAKLKQTLQAFGVRGEGQRPILVLRVELAA